MTSTRISTGVKMISVGAEMSGNWYYAEGDETVGPVSLDELLSALRQRKDALRVLVWQQSFQDWTEVASVPELSSLIMHAPPSDRQQAATAPVPAGRPFSPLAHEHRQAPASDKDQRNRNYAIVGSVVAAVCAILGKVLGAVFWLPTLLIGISALAFTKLKLRNDTAAMLGVLLGHTLWMISGHLLLLAQDQPDPDLLSFSFDFVVVLALMTWGIKTQSVAMSVCVLIYQLFCLGANVIPLYETSNLDAAGPYMHIALRTLGVGTAIYAVVSAKRFKRETPLDERLSA
jgi:hypothetical protein